MCPLSRWTARGPAGLLANCLPSIVKRKTEQSISVAEYTSTAIFFGASVLYRSRQIALAKSPIQAHKAEADSVIFRGVGKNVSTPGVKTTVDARSVTAAGIFNPSLPIKAVRRIFFASDGIDEIESFVRPPSPSIRECWLISVVEGCDDDEGVTTQQPKVSQYGVPDQLGKPRRSRVE